MKSTKPSEQELLVVIDIFKKKYPNESITKYIAEKYFVTGKTVTDWYKSFKIKIKVGRPEKGKK